MTQPLKRISKLGVRLLRTNTASAFGTRIEALEFHGFTLQFEKSFDVRLTTNETALLFFGRIFLSSRVPPSLEVASFNWDFLFRTDQFFILEDSSSAFHLSTREFQGYFYLAFAFSTFSFGLDRNRKDKKIRRHDSF